MTANYLTMDKNYILRKLATAQTLAEELHRLDPNNATANYITMLLEPIRRGEDYWVGQIEGAVIEAQHELDTTLWVSPQQ